jgi:hypothetical protein
MPHFRNAAIDWVDAAFSNAALNAPIGNRQSLNDPASP